MFGSSGGIDGLGSGGGSLSDVGRSVRVMCLWDVCIFCGGMWIVVVGYRVPFEFE